MDQVERQAVAAFADRLAAALTGLAHDLRGAPTPAAGGGSGTRPAARRRAQPEPPAEAEEAARAPRGSRQQQVLSLPGLDAAQGMTAGEVAAALDWPASHPHRVFEQLIKKGIVEVVPDATPRAWRRKPH